MGPAPYYLQTLKAGPSHRWGPTPTMRTPSPSRPSSLTSPVRVGLVSRCALALSLLPWVSLPLQAAPDAGSLLQEIERSKPTPPPPKSPQLIQPLAPEKKGREARIVVTHFVFKDNTLIDSQTLEAALASYMNRPVSFAQLQAAWGAIVDCHAAQGWQVRAQLPDNSKLPDWLKFTAGSVPPNALPLRVQVIVGNRRILVDITEMSV